MKKTLLALTLAALAAGPAFAQEANPESPPSSPATCDLSGPRAKGKHAMRGDSDRPGGPMDPAMMAQMKAAHQEIKALGDAARAVTNEAAKAEIVAQLRAKLGEVADLIQTHREQRLAQAEERLVGLKDKIEESKANRDALIEEQLQRILSGERPPHSEAFRNFPHAKGAHHGEAMRDERRGHDLPECGGLPPPPDADGEEPPPPPDEEDGVPPPPPEE